MLSIQEAEATRLRNYRRLRELIRVSWGLGVNLHRPTPFRESLKIINVGLIVFSVVSLWQHWIQLVKFIDHVDKIAETVCTALQTTIGVVKLFYYFFRQHRVYLLLRRVMTHELLQKIEIVDKDFPELDQLKSKINAKMDVIWKDIRFKLLFYLCCCSAILLNYMCNAVFVNLYHQLKGTPDYVPILPLTGHPIWVEKGMNSWYYLFEMFISTCALYIAGMTAVSFEGVFIVFSIYAVGMIEVLNLLVSRSTSPAVLPERRVEYMRYCIRQYQRVYDYIEEVNDIYMHMSLSQFLQSLILFGFLLFQMNIGLESSMVIFFRMVLYMAAAGNQIVIYDVNGQRLSSITETIPMTFYSIEWYNESQQFRQLVQMMIHRTNRTYFFKISWFSTMKLATLVAVFKASGSYFLLLRDVSE